MTMKTRFLAAGVFGLCALTMTGCLVAPVQPPVGAIYSNYSAPLDYTAHDKPIANLKKGTSESTSILGLVATGDASVSTAAKNGGIAKIHHVDYSYQNIIGVYQKFTVEVWGE